MRDNRRVIVLCTHNLQEAEALADMIAVVRNGQIVACGTAADLTQQLLGEPVWELRTAVPLEVAHERFLDLVPIERVAADRLQYRTSDARALNPVLLERLHTAGVGVISLSELPRSLEAVYLHIIGEAGSTGTKALDNAAEQSHRKAIA